MNIKALAAAVSLLAAVGSAHAQQTEFTPPDAGFRSTLTRAEVRQELMRSDSQGQHEWQDPTYAGSGKTRGDVKAEQESAARQQEWKSLVDTLYFG